MSKTTNNRNKTSATVRVGKNAKENTPMCSVLTRICSFFYSNFEKMTGVHIKISSPAPRQKFENMELEANEHFISLDNESFTINVPVSEAIEVALQCFYFKYTPTNIEKLSFKRVLKLAVTNDYAKSNGNYNCQSENLHKKKNTNN